MPSEPQNLPGINGAQARVSAPSGRGSLAVACLLALTALSGCIGGAPRPTTPTYTGNQRPDPSRPPRPGEPIPGAAVSERYADSRNAYQPRHIARADAGDLKRIAVLLPFSSTDAEVRRLSRGLFNAIQMSLFEIGASDIVLMPKDSSGDTNQVAGAADEAIRDGAIAIVGPLFAQQIPAVAAEAREVNAPVFSFSTDVTALGQGAYLMSLTPKTEIERIVDYATLTGVTRFAMFGPNTAYGRTVETALREEVARRGGLVIAAEYYNPGDSSPQAAAKRLATVVRAEDRASPGKVAVLIPERGVQLRTVASLLPYFDVNVRTVKFLGTGAWNDPEVWREPSLFGGAFPAPDPASVADFEQRYLATFGEAAPNLSSYGYDAGALAATLADIGRLDAAMLQRQEGWSGVNGLFRFQPDGSVQRALTVMQVQTQGGVKIVSPAVVAFTAGS
ncbi:MAG: penicillin-binding protein activator [Alphaproteobacteria bacterium]|nr:penicillin-binding protein activator [Alphaproteobacteria bacterium]